MPKIRKVILLLISILVVLTLGEIFARVLAPDVFEGNIIRYLPGKRKRLIPNTQGVLKNHRLSKKNILMRINSHGFRGEDFPLEKPADEFRILFLGDSITWGDYLHEEETFVNRVGFYLNRSTPQKKVRVINGGVGDIGIQDEVGILEEKGLGVSPDLVVLEFYLNDSRPPWGFPGELGTPGFFRQQSQLVDTLYRRFKLKGWIQDQGGARFPNPETYQHLDWLNNQEDFRKMAQVFQYDWGAAWNKDSWTVVKKELETIKKHAGKHHFKVLVVAFPLAQQAYTSFVEDEPQRILKEISQKLGFSYVDLLPHLRKAHKGEKLFFDHCHPIEKANDLIGKVLAKAIRDNSHQESGR